MSPSIRFAWTDADLTVREWFVGCADSRGMVVEVAPAGSAPMSYSATASRWFR
jgi:hypothetical protein